MIFRLLAAIVMIIVAALFIVTVLMVLSVAAYAQPYALPRAEENMKVEIRYFAPGATRAAKLRIIPSVPGDDPSYAIWPLAMRAYPHMEPCWRSASACEVSRITVRTLYRIPVLGTWVDVTRFWCARNSDGQCEMPAFDQVSVPPGESLCMTYDRVTAAWKVAPRVCTAADVGVPRQAVVTPDGVSAPHGASSLTDAQGAVWWLAPPDPKCEGGSGTAVMRDTKSVGVAEQLRICAGVVWARADGAWYRSSQTASCGGSGWGRAQSTPPC